MPFNFLKFFVLLQLPISVLGGSMVCAMGRIMGSSMPIHEEFRSRCPSNQFYCRTSTTNTNEYRCLPRTELRCAEGGTTIGRDRYRGQGIVPGTGCLSDHGINYCGVPSIYSARMPNFVIIPDLAFYPIFLGASQLDSRKYGNRGFDVHFGRQFIHHFIMFRGFIYDYGKTYNARELDPDDYAVTEWAKIDRDWKQPLGISACTRGDVCFHAMANINTYSYIRIRYRYVSKIK